ncbi:MAG: ABC transporter permease [Lachnospiraceae bacterium]
MRSEVMTIIRKEFKRFFGDRRLWFSTIVLPGLLIYVLYSIMGNMMQDAFTPDEGYEPVIYVCNAPQSVQTILKSLDYTYTDLEMEEADHIKQKIEEQSVDALLVFPDRFDEDVMAYDAIAAGTPAPEIDFYYNSASTESEALYQTLTEVFNTYESTMTNKFDINRETDVKYDLATEADTTARLFSMMVPMLLVMMLMSGCMSVAPDAIAGEKERGTMATLLVTPVKRSSIALGKVVSLAVFALLSGLSSTLGVLLSLPKLMGSEQMGVSAMVYTMSDYVALAVTVLAAVLSIICIFALISTYAKSVKEAGSLSSPVMILGIVLAVTSSMGGSQPPLYRFCIPIYNSVLMFGRIFSMDYTGAQLGVTVAGNFVFVALSVFAMTRMFNSERIMFSR